MSKQHYILILVYLLCFMTNKAICATSLDLRPFRSKKLHKVAIVPDPSVYDCRLEAGTIQSLVWPTKKTAASKWIHVISYFECLGSEGITRKRDNLKFILIPDKGQILLRIGRKESQRDGDRSLHHATLAGKSKTEGTTFNPIYTGGEIEYLRPTQLKFSISTGGYECGPEHETFDEEAESHQNFILNFFESKDFECQKGSDKYSVLVTINPKCDEGTDSTSAFDDSTGKHAED